MHLLNFAAGPMLFSTLGEELNLVRTRFEQGPEQLSYAAAFSADLAVANAMRPLPNPQPREQAPSGPSL